MLEQATPLLMANHLNTTCLSFRVVHGNAFYLHRNTEFLFRTKRNLIQYCVDFQIVISYFHSVDITHSFIYLSNVTKLRDDAFFSIPISGPDNIYFVTVWINSKYLYESQTHACNLDVMFCGEYSPMIATEVHQNLEVVRIACKGINFVDQSMTSLTRCLI